VQRTIRRKLLAFHENESKTASTKLRDFSRRLFFRTLSDILDSKRGILKICAILKLNFLYIHVCIYNLIMYVCMCKLIKLRVRVRYLLLSCNTIYFGEMLTLWRTILSPLSGSKGKSKEKVCRNRQIS
jgi:hypothetical protein